MSDPRLVVVLTATVVPDPGLGRLALADPGERLRQYRRAISAWANWARGTGSSVLVAESSGVGAGELLEGVGRRCRDLVSYAHVDPPAHVRARGKGASEWSMIASAIAQARDLTAGTTIYKVTGRLTLANAPRVLVPLGPHDVAVRMTADRSFADTRVIGARREIWESVLLPAGDDADDGRGVYVEHAVAGHIARAAALRRCEVRSFPVRPRIVGASGSTGADYGDSRPELLDVVTGRLEGWLRQLASKKQV